ncbi:MAG: hypothetical protein ACI4FZ_03000 [Lachnospiraceae bacterium]
MVFQNIEALQPDVTVEKEASLAAKVNTIASEIALFSALKVQYQGTELL